MEIGTYDHVYEPRRVHDESHLDYGRLATLVRQMETVQDRDQILSFMHEAGLTPEIMGYKYPLFPSYLGHMSLGAILNRYTSDTLMMIDWTVVAWPERPKEEVILGSEDDFEEDGPDGPSPLNFLTPYRDRKEIQFGMTEEDLVTGGGFEPPAPSPANQCVGTEEPKPPDIGQGLGISKPSVAYATEVSKERGADQCGPVGGVSTQPTACRPACDPERSGKPKPPRPPDLRRPRA